MWTPCASCTGQHRVGRAIVIAFRAPAAYMTGLLVNDQRAMQGEYEHTGKEFVMLRSCMDALFQIAEHAQGQGPGDTDPSAEGKPAPEVTACSPRLSLQFLLSRLGQKCFCRTWSS